MPFGSPKTSSPPLRRLAQAIPLKVIAVPADKAAEILKDPRLQGYRRAKISKGAIKGLDADVDSLAVGTFTSTRADLPDDIAYTFTKAFFENLKQFHPVHASAKQYTLKGSLADPTIRFIPGPSVTTRRSAPGRTPWRRPKQRCWPTSDRTRFRQTVPCGHGRV